MKQVIKWITAFGVLIPITWFHSVSITNDMADLQRLQWLCKDYQIPIQGYVIEGWFQLECVAGVERFLQEELAIQEGIHRLTLSDGSILTTVMQRKNKMWQIELQLIAKSDEQASRYYGRWQRFSNIYCPKNPIGITVIAVFPETIDIDNATIIAKEIADGLDLEIVAQISDEQYLQISGYSNQLVHQLCINGEKINNSITIVPEEAGTSLYIASPVLYQQI